MSIGAYSIERRRNEKKEKKRQDYAFRRQFNEKRSIVPGCPGCAAACRNQPKLLMRLQLDSTAKALLSHEHLKLVV